MRNLTKVQDQIIKIVKQFDDGDISVLDALVNLEEYRNGLEDSLAIIKAFKDENLDSIEYSSKEYNGEFKGYKIEVRSGGQMYIFKNIPEWQDLEKKRKDFEEKSKAALQASLKGIQTADEDGVEIPLPEVSYRKSSVVMKKVK